MVKSLLTKIYGNGLSIVGKLIEIPEVDMEIFNLFDRASCELK